MRRAAERHGSQLFDGSENRLNRHVAAQGARKVPLALGTCTSENSNRTRECD
jgi:hypothetical protein